MRLCSWMHVLKKQSLMQSCKIRLWDAPCGCRSKESNLTTLSACARVITLTPSCLVFLQLISTRSSIRGMRAWTCVSSSTIIKYSKYLIMLRFNILCRYSMHRMLQIFSTDNEYQNISSILRIYAYSSIIYVTYIINKCAHMKRNAIISLHILLVRAGSSD